MDGVGRANDARNGLVLLSLSTANTGWIMQKPPPSLTLSVAEGEALIARVHQSGGEEGASDAEPGASSTEARSKPTGGQRLGTGRLGAEA